MDDRVSKGKISADLRELTAEIEALDSEVIAHGVLGGSHGYGGEFENDVFEMHPFWWGDCECRFTDLESEWYATHSHSPSCYQSVIRQRGYSTNFEEPYTEREAKNRRVTNEVCAEMGLDPNFGSAVHCTCSYKTDWAEWVSNNDHDPTCRIVLPNFRHKASGVSVRWYKYIGRGMEVPEVDRKAWRKIYNECIESLSIEDPA
jgi:hypothetical protein